MGNPEARIFSVDNSANKRETRPEGENPQITPDSTMQTGHSSNMPMEEKKLTNIIRSNENPADAISPIYSSTNTLEPIKRIMSVTDIIKSIFRHKWIMLVIFILVSAPALALVWTQIVPKYQAQAQVRVRPIIPYLVFKTEDSGAVPFYESYLQTQSAIIKTDTVLQRVLDQPEIKQTQWYKNTPKSLVQRATKNPLAPLGRLKKALSTKNLTGTEIIDITFIDPSPKDAQLIVNLVVEQYMDYVIEMSDATQDKLYNQLVEEYKSLVYDIDGLEKGTAVLRQRLGTATPEELISGQRIRLDLAQARLTEVQQNIKILEWEIDQVASSDSNDSSEPLVDDTIDDTMKQLFYFQDAEWRRLDVNVKTIQNTIATTQLTPNNPNYNRLTKELAFAEELLQKKQKQLDLQWQYRQKNLTGLTTADTNGAGQNYIKNLQLLQYQLGKAKYQEQLFDADFKMQQTEFEELFSRAQLLEKENITIAQKRELSEAVRQRLEQKNMERNVPGSIELLTRATSSKPYEDNRIKFSAIVFIIALGLGAGAAFLKDSMQKVMYTFKDLPYPMQVPFLGYIPITPIRKLAGKSIASRYEQKQQDQSSMIESIRVVRTTLLSRLNGQDSTTVLVTSSTEGTGKSTFTMMLGESLARSGKKVLLIDADFRKKTLTKQFDFSDQSGFIQSLSCGSPNKYHIFPIEKIPGMSFMPAGTQDNKGAAFEDTANGDFKLHINKLRKMYNFILLDSPPVLPVADAAILSNQVDGTIIVERELVSRRTDVINALARLSSAGGQLLGTVFIGSDSNGKYGYS